MLLKMKEVVGLLAAFACGKTLCQFNLTRIVRMVDAEGAEGLVEYIQRSVATCFA
jgi:hypothetical protein